MYSKVSVPTAYVTYRVYASYITPVLGGGGHTCYLHGQGIFQGQTVFKVKFSFLHKNKFYNE